MNKTTLLSFLFLFISVLTFAQNDFPDKPGRLVNDYTQTLSPSQVQALESKLVAFNDSTTTQIAVVLIPSLNGYEVADYRVRLAQKWGIGGKENDNGVDGALQDAIALQIINNDIKHSVARQDYYGGIEKATDALISSTKGEYKAKPRKKQSEGAGGISVIFVVIFFVIVSLISRGG